MCNTLNKDIFDNAGKKYNWRCFVFSDYVKDSFLRMLRKVYLNLKDQFNILSWNIKMSAKIKGNSYLCQLTQIMKYILPTKVTHSICNLICRNMFKRILEQVLKQT